MTFIDVTEKRIGPFPITEAVGSPGELARALRVRYYRTVHPTEIGNRKPDPPALVANLRKYSETCTDQNWPVIILRPELNRHTWGVVVMLPSRAQLTHRGNPGDIVDYIYGGIRMLHKEKFADVCVVCVTGESYRMYQGMPLASAEIMAFGLADMLGRKMAVKSHA